MERVTVASPFTSTRVIGAIYLLYFLAALGSALLAKGLSIPDDPAATASAILAHESLYRSSLAVDLIANALYIAVVGLLYTLFVPVSQSLSLIAAFFGLVGCAVQIFGNTFRIAALFLLNPNDWLNPFNAEQMNAAALMCIKLHALTFNSSLVLFGLFNIMIGYLILRSTLLPRLLGVLMTVAGLGWLIFLWPPLATAMSAYILPLGAFAELLLMLWLLIRGTRSAP
jgi:Domain of unknown function (DUF4386)